MDKKIRTKLNNSSPHVFSTKLHRFLCPKFGHPNLGQLPVKLKLNFCTENIYCRLKVYALILEF